MDRHSSLPSLNFAFGGLAEFSCQDYTTEPQLCYQGMSVQALLPPPCSAYFSQSNADQNNAHPVNPLEEFRVSSLTQAVSSSFDELVLTVIPESILDKHVPWNPDKESVYGSIAPIIGSNLCNQSLFSGSKPDISEPTSANRLNPDHHLTNFPAELVNPQDSRPVALANPLNLQQVTNDNPANSVEIVDDKSSQVERRNKRKREQQRRNDKSSAIVERERKRCQNDSVYAEGQDL